MEKCPYHESLENKIDSIADSITRIENKIKPIAEATEVFVDINEITKRIKKHKKLFISLIGIGTIITLLLIGFPVDKIIDFIKSLI